MIKVYGIKNCDSVKKAIKFLKSNHITYEFIDFKEKPVNKEQILLWLESTDLKTLFNTRSTTYRTLKLKDLNLSDDEKIFCLGKENLLIKRPVITFVNSTIVGYNKSQYLEQLINKI